MLVNAASLKEGGSIVVLDRLLNWMRQLRGDIDWLVAAHPSIVLQGSDQRNFVQLRIRDIGQNALGVMYWYEAALPAFIEQYEADLVFSITNYLPFRRLKIPSVLLVQNAGHFSKLFDELNRQYLRRPDRIAAWKLKTRWVKRSVLTANEVTVQTLALADAIATSTGRPREHICAIPHGPGLVTLAPVKRRSRNGHPVRIGYVTRWGVQKNFGVLFDAAARLNGQGRSIRLILTLREDLPENRSVLERAAATGLGEVLENAGEVDAAGVSALYDSLDIFAFPSLVESFGFPLVEAMAKGVPIVAADTPSNREIAGNAGLYFQPTDAEALAGILGQLIDNASLRTAKSAAAFHRAQDFSWHRAAERTLALFDAALSAAPPCRRDRMLRQV